MEVVLVSSKKGLGKAGEIVVVKDGYARNYLIPNNIAVYASKMNKDMISEMRESIAEENRKAWEKASELADKIKGTMISIVRQIGNNGKLFGSVSIKDVIDSFAHMGFDVPKESILIKKPIKLSGVYQIDVDLHYEVSVKIYLSVGRSEEECKELFEHFLKTNKSDN